MTTPTIVFLDRATFADDIVWRRPEYAHHWREYATTAVGETAARIAEAQVVITNKVRIDRAALSAAPQLQWVLVAATGTDNVDLDACRERGIRVQNVVGYGVTSVAEHVFATMLSLRRNLIAYRDSVIAGRWQAGNQFCYHDFAIHELRGACLAIIGAGMIGAEVSRIANAFGMRVIHAERKHQAARTGRVTFNDALAQADIISLHCPLTAETRGLIGAHEFTLMVRRPLLINTARGALIDGHALVTALQTKQVSGVALDVTSMEPLRHDDPLHSILDQANVLVTPHVAWASRTAQQRLADSLAAELDTFTTDRNTLR